MKTTSYRVSVIITVPNTALLYDLARSAAHLRHGRWTRYAGAKAIKPSAMVRMLSYCQKRVKLS